MLAPRNRDCQQGVRKWDAWRVMALCGENGGAPKGLIPEPMAVDGEHRLSACNLDSMLVCVESEPRVQPKA